MRVTYVNVRARHLLKKSMVRAPKNMVAIVIAIVMNLPGMTLQPLYTGVSLHCACTFTRTAVCMLLASTYRNNYEVYMYKDDCK